MAERRTRASGDRTRERLLDAALDEFALHGFGGASTRDIASRGGISAAAMYAHHRSKEDLLFHIAREGHENALRIIQRVLAENAGPVDQLVQVVKTLAAGHAAEQKISRVVAYEVRALTEEHFAEISTIRRVTVGLVRAVVEYGVEIEVFDSPNIDMTVMALFSMCIDIARWFSPDHAWTPEAIGDHYARLALQMVGADDEVIADAVRRHDLAGSLSR